MDVQEAHLVNFCSLDTDSGTNMGMVFLCLKQMFSQTAVLSHGKVAEPSEPPARGGSAESEPEPRPQG